MLCLYKFPSVVIIVVSSFVSSFLCMSIRVIWFIEILRDTRRTTDFILSEGRNLPDDFKWWQTALEPV